MIKKLLSVHVWGMSIGWLIPLILFSYYFWHWIETEAAPVVYNIQPQINSFPYLFVARKMFLLGGIWFAMVVVVWSGILLFKYIWKNNEK